MDRGGSLALTLSQKQAQTHVGVSPLLSPWELGKRQPAFSLHSPAHHSKSLMSLGTWDQAEQGKLSEAGTSS